MGKIIACIDGSTYADSVTYLSAWAHKRSGLAVSLLHVVPPNSEIRAKADISGQIGMGAKSNLLDELVELDEEHNKLEMRKGQIMLAHAKEVMEAKGVMQVEMLHRRGALVETIVDMEADLDLIVIGKRGEHSHAAPGHLGSNLERVARAIHKPLLVVTQEVKPVKKLLIAYDGSPSADKAVDYAANNALMEGLECHLLKVGEATTEAQNILKQAEDKLNVAGVTVHASCKTGKPVQTAVAEYITEKNIDMLMIGAYGHSRIHTFILGSVTTGLIRKTDVPIMLFR